MPKALVVVAVPLVVAILAMAGCGGNPEAKDKVDQAISLITSTQPLLEDLLSLNERFNTLGTRFANVEDTIAEGKSLAEMALMGIDELEVRYTRARGMLQEVTDMERAGDYAEYARLALVAVDAELEAMNLNRELLTDVWDLLDVLPLAESEEQLSYYTGEIDRLTGEISDLLVQSAEAAEEADSYYREKGL